MGTIRLRDGRIGELPTELITPARADTWGRTSRRGLKTRRVRMFEKLFRQGKLHKGGRICIVGGFVVTGQHELKAIANTGIATEMQVLRVQVPGSSHFELR